MVDWSSGSCLPAQLQPAGISEARGVELGAVPGMTWVLAAVAARSDPENLCTLGRHLLTQERSGEFCG